MPSLRDLVEERFDQLSNAQQRVAGLLVESPSTIAFGTVAEVAAAADTSPPTVLRFANALDRTGFSELQEAVRDELLEVLRPAADRIRERPGPDPVAEALTAGTSNIRRTLEAVDPATLAAVAALLADRRHAVGVLAGDAWSGLGSLLARQLGDLRRGVTVVDGPGPRVSRQLADLAAGDALLVLDVHRYERWVIDASARAAAAGVRVVALTDRALSPLRASASHTFVVHAASSGPFESATGVTALLDLLVTAVAGQLRRTATDRLDRIEAAWAEGADLLQ